MICFSRYFEKGSHAIRLHCFPNYEALEYMSTYYADDEPYSGVSRDYLGTPVVEQPGKFDNFLLKIAF